VACCSADVRFQRTKQSSIEVDVGIRFLRLFSAGSVLVFFLAASRFSYASGVALVQSASTQGSGVSSVTATFPNKNGAGNLIIVFVRASTTTQTVTITDSAANSYVQAVSQMQTSDGHQTRIFYAKNIAAGPNTVRATFSGINNHPWLAVYEYSGLSTTAPLDQVAHAQGSSSSANSGLTAVTTSANELIFAGLGLPSGSSVTVAAGSGFTLALQDTNQSGSRAASENKIVSAAGAYAGVFTLSGSTYWSCVVATFRQASTTVSLSPVSLVFSSQTVNTASTAQTVTLTNTGSANLTINSTAITGDFGQTNNCGTSLAGGKSCTFSVIFTPTATGTRTGALTISDNASGSPQSVSLTGAGATAPPLSITTASLPNGIVGSPYSASLSASGGTPPYTWYVASGALPSTVALAATTGSISGTPTATGSFNVTLQVSDAANHSATQSYSLVVSARDYEVQLTWAASPSQNVTGYNVYRSVNGGTSFTKITPSPVVGLAYTDLTVIDGQSYDYAVTAVNASGNESVYSQDVQINVP
jgi:hypothetical protein